MEITATDRQRSRSPEIRGKRAKKAALLRSLKNNLGNVTNACSVAGVSRRTFYNYKSEDPSFALEAEDIGEGSIDFVESELLKQIDRGSIRAIIFFLKSKGRRRGYGNEPERTEKEEQRIMGIRRSELPSEEAVFQILMKLAEAKGYTFQAPPIRQGESN